MYFMKTIVIVIGVTTLFSLTLKTFYKMENGSKLKYLLCYYCTCKSCTILCDQFHIV